MRRHLRAIVYIFAVAVGLGGIVLGFMSARTGDTEKPVVFNQYVVRLVPSPKAIILRQSQVGIVLKEGFEGRLVIDGKDIPDDQVYAKAKADPAGSGSVDTASLGDNIPRNNVLFTPGPNTEFERFSPGEHCMVAVFWLITEGPDVNPQRQEWCFKAA